MNSLQKPARGTALLERKARRKDRVRAEQKVMHAALVRDRYKCRFPRCTFKDMPIDPCHMTHRGLGGNPAGDRTARETVIALCRCHHGQYDTSHALLIQPIDPMQQFDGLCDFLQEQPGGGYRLIGRN